MTRVRFHSVREMMMRCVVLSGLRSPMLESIRRSGVKQPRVLRLVAVEAKNAGTSAGPRI